MFTLKEACISNEEFFSAFISLTLSKVDFIKKNAWVNY